MTATKLPKQWAMIPLEEVATFTSGGTPSKANDSYWNGDIPWISAKDLKSFYLRDSIDKITSTATSNGTRLVPEGSILILVRGMTLLKDVPVGVTTCPMAFNQDVRALVVKKEFDARFIAYSLVNRKAELMSLVNVAGHGTGRLASELLQSVPIRVPKNLYEQQKIAAILSTWDRAIELTEKLIAAKRKRKQALMQHLLTGKVRLPKFQGDERNQAAGIVRVPSAVRRGLYPPSVQPGIPKIILRPKGWDETTMDKILRIEKRSIELLDDKEYQLVVAKRNRGGIEPRERLRGYEVKTPTQFEVRAGDFVISKRQIIHGACGVVPASLDGAVVSNEYSVFTVNGSLDMEFLKYLSHTLYFQQTCFHASVGVALEKMIFRLEEWLKFPFLIPTFDEQRAIVSVLAAMDNAICLLSKRLSLLSQQKKGLMQQLLTGKVRVNASKQESIHA